MTEPSTPKGSDLELREQVARIISKGPLPGPYAKADAILSLISAARKGQGEWRLIESAPKDGTPILVWRADVKPGVPYCDVTAWPAGWQGSWPTAYMHYADGNEPTHWQPLPPPPELGE